MHKGAKMRHKQIDSIPKTYILVFEKGDELAKGLWRNSQQRGGYLLPALKRLEHSTNAAGVTS
jgi:hypothetical protein